MTAALYAARAGLSTLLFETMSAGGQMNLTDKINNYPGFPDGVDGFELGMNMRQQAQNFGAEFVNEQVTSLQLPQDDPAGPKTLVTPYGTYTARAVIMAMGARSRKLGAPGEEELAGRGVSYCATCDGGFFRGKTCVVVGGGNTAAEDAVYLSRICPQVHVIHRRDALRATVAEQRALAAAQNVVMEWNSVVVSIEDEDGKVCAVQVEDVHTHEVRTIPTSAVFVAVGKLPNTEEFADVLPLDKSGYIIADESGATELPGVYAAGDVRVKHLRQVATAVSDGANAAESAAAWLATL